MSDEKKKTGSGTFKLGVFLCVIGAISAGLLAGVDALTRKPIKRAELRKTSDALKEVLPAFDNVPAEEKTTVESPSGRKVVFYAAKKGGKLVGIAGEGYSPKGFAGKIYVMVGLDVAGTVRVVIVTRQNETPGLGTVVTDRVREKTVFDLFGGGKKEAGLPPNKVLDSFDGLTAAVSGKPWKVKKDGGRIDFVTGATISSRAVTDAVYDVAIAFSKNKAEILKRFGYAPPSQ